jgi:hypothetical protein
MSKSVLRSEKVADCVQELLTHKMNPVFSGYLCLKRTAARDRTTVNLKPNFKEFYETFLRTTGGPSGRPNLRPFWHQSRAANQIWTHNNPAGTYSAKSAARSQAFLEVVTISGTGTKAAYSLKERHWEAAKEFMLYRQPTPVVSLAAFLYRDYAFEDEGGVSADTLVRVFRTEFGYEHDTFDTADAEFGTLYYRDEDDGEPSDWFLESPE